MMNANRRLKEEEDDEKAQNIHFDQFLSFSLFSWF